MTPQSLFTILSKLLDEVLADPRWDVEKDDLGISVLGMLIYGLALAQGRLVFLLDIEDINAIVTRCLVERVGAAEKWSCGLVTDASRSAFDSNYHAGNFELIGVGHSYYGVHDRAAVINNVFANINSVRARARSS